MKEESMSNEPQPISSETKVSMSLNQFWVLLIAIIASSIWLTANINNINSKLSLHEALIGELQASSWTINMMKDLYTSKEAWTNNITESTQVRRAVIQDIVNNE